MTGCKTDEAREFYLRLCIANRYTKRELDRQIGSMLYERTMISHEKHKDLLTGNGGLAALRDSYSSDGHADADILNFCCKLL